MAYIDNVTNILQIQPDGLPTFVRLSQNENGRNLYFQLAGNEIDIPANATITISGTKPDGTVYSGTGSISDNVILIPEMIQMTAVAGYWDAKVKIISGGNTIATGRIRFVIDADTVDPDSVPSDSELEGLVAEAQQYAETARTEAYGSPLTATTAAGMTDHTRVYVYTGSETGYTAGHWYYWNGSAWTDGGIYNSTAVNTDPTLTLAGVAADAKATGDAIEAARVAIDDTLTNEGEAADAAAVGSEISGLKEDLTDEQTARENADNAIIGDISRLDEEIIVSNAYFGSDKGYAVHINGGAVGSKLKSLVCELPYNANGYGSIYIYNVKGKNLLGGINPTQTINGVTFTVNADGTITTSGTSSAVATFFICNIYPFKSGVTYALTGCPKGGSLATYSMSFGGTLGLDTGDGGVFTPTTDTQHDVRIRIASGINTDGLTFKPMLRYAYRTSEKYNENILAIKTGVTNLNGLTFVRNPDGSVVVNGTATAFTSFFIQTDTQFVAGKTYKLSGCPSGGSATTFRMAIGGIYTVDTGEGGIYTEESTTTHDVRIMVNSGVTLANTVFRPYLTEIKDVESKYTETDVETIVIGFPVLIYGGYIDIVTGEITSTTAQNGSAINPPAKCNVTPHPIEIGSDNTIFANLNYAYLSCEYIKDLDIERERVANADFLENYKKYRETFVTSSLTVGLPIIYLVGDTSAMNKDIEANLDWYYNGKSGKCTLKWQGSSSIAYSKKNYTIKFDSNVDFGKGWGAHKKYNLKANYIDFTASRNVVSAKLWGAIVKSRSVQNPYLYNLPNGGAIDGFPMIVVLNDEYLGLFDMNIPKDKWMFNMTGSATHEGLLSAEDHSNPTRFKATITEQELRAGTSFEVEYAPDESDIGWMATSVSQAISAVMNATSASDAETINQYIDLESVIDHYIFACLIGGTDITDKNYLLATFDGTKWYMSEWDLDTTFGNHWTGGSYNPANVFPTFADYAAQSDLMKFVYTYQKSALKARYTALRAGTMSESNVMRQFYNFDAVIPKALKDIDIKKYPLLPTTDTGTVAQVAEWYTQRCKVLDAEINALT